MEEPHQFRVKEFPAALDRCMGDMMQDRGFCVASAITELDSAETPAIKKHLPLALLLRRAADYAVLEFLAMPVAQLKLDAWNSSIDS